MEATHFIEFYKFDGIMYDTGVAPIQALKNAISFSEEIGAETVAVWRIKPTDVPIERRLGERIGKGMVRSIEEYAKLHEGRNVGIKKQPLAGILGF